MRWFWYFVFYSFCGFLLEVIFAFVTRHPKRDRKCFCLLPLCPVYGLGAVAILLLPRQIQENPMLLLLLGGGTATVVEYLVGTWDQQVLGVRFWNYEGWFGNVKGKVCLPFSAAWGLLTLPLVQRLHPMVAHWGEKIPLWLFAPLAVLVLGDGLRSAWLLRSTGTTECLKWSLKPL